MDTQIEITLDPGRLAACAAGIVAATLLAGCAPESDPNETHTQASASSAHPVAADFYVGTDDGVVTVSAHDVPLRAVIEKLADQGGLRVLARDPLDQRVTLELRSPTLTAALQELLRGRSFILGTGTLWVLSKQPDGSGADGSVGSREDSPESVPSEATKTLDELSAALADPDANARLDAVAELSDHFKDEQAAILLASVAAHDENPSVRAEALHAIGGGRAELHSPVFRRALKDRDAVVRMAAITALEDVGGESSLQTLASALQDRDPSVRVTAVDAIAEIGGRDARRLLEAALGDESAAVREAATEHLVLGARIVAGHSVMAD